MEFDQDTESNSPTSGTCQGVSSSLFEIWDLGSCSSSSAVGSAIGFLAVERPAQFVVHSDVEAELRDILPGLLDYTVFALQFHLHAFSFAFLLIFFWLLGA